MCSLFLAVLHSPIMANQSFSSDIRRYALTGAQARLAEISLELEAIRRAFPELRENGSSGARTRRPAMTGGDVSITPYTRPPQHHVRRPAQSCWRADEEVLGRTPGRDRNSRRRRPSKQVALRSAKVARAAKSAKRGAAKRGPRKISAAARKRMSQAQKKRWAAKRKSA